MFWMGGMESAYERRGDTTGFIKIGVSLSVRLGDDAPSPGEKMSLDGRKRCERVSQRGNRLAVAAEFVDDDDRALGVTDTQELGLH